MEDLQIVESIARKDPQVIEQCGIIGIPPEDMHKVYCDRKFGRGGVQVAFANLKQHGRLDTTSDSDPRSVFNKR